VLLLLLQAELVRCEQDHPGTGQEGPAVDDYSANLQQGQQGPD
jgi:hypothetical protein